MTIKITEPLDDKANQAIANFHDLVSALVERRKSRLRHKVCIAENEQHTETKFETTKLPILVESFPGSIDRWPSKPFTLGDGDRDKTVLDRPNYP